jgi:CubicO group peptidase (beta-lactamase class C family)
VTGARGVRLLLPAAALVLGCSGAPEETPGALTDGAWRAEAGPETFLFEISSPAASPAGVVHTVVDGKKLRELPITSAAWDPPRLDLHMAATGVRYVGKVDLAHGRIAGRVIAPDGSATEMPLTWVDLERYPGVRARPAPPAGEPEYAYRPPEPRGDGWEVAEPEAAGLDRAALERLVVDVIHGEAGVLHSLLVARGGKLVLEEYFHGYGPGDLEAIASCTKSVASLLVGIARDRGHAIGLDASVLDFFPDLAERSAPGWDRVTVRHLLTMSAGLDWTDEEAESVHGAGPELFRRVLARHVTGEPGAAWRYVSANVNLLAGVLKTATGEQADAFAARELFGPLGIETWDWERGKVEGFPQMDGTLRLRPRDMAKLGALVLDGGRWAGRRVVSEDWIRRSTAPAITNREGPGGRGAYGFLWWVWDLPGPTGPKRLVFANGLGSQFVLIFPDDGLVMVTTGGNQDNGKHLAPGRVIQRHLLAG